MKLGYIAINQYGETVKLTEMRRVKKTLGWAGIRCTVTNYGDLIDIRPAGAALVAFVTWEE